MHVRAQHVRGKAILVGAAREAQTDVIGGDRVERSGSSLDHTLATALVGPDGRIVDIWCGNAWNPEEVAARIGGP